MKPKRYYLILLTALVFYGGCANTTEKAFSSKSGAIQLRSMQTRKFDTTDKNLMMRNVIATLQDLDFVVTDADELLGSITARKYMKNISFDAMVLVRPSGNKQLSVRLNAQHGLETIEDPEPYQDFFASLEKSIFLTAHQVD